MKKTQSDYFELILFGSVLLISWTLFQLYYINYAVTGNLVSLNDAFGFENEAHNSIFKLTIAILYSFFFWLISLIYSRLKLGIFRKIEIIFWCVALASLLLWSRGMYHMSKVYLFESGQIPPIEYFQNKQAVEFYKQYQLRKKAKLEYRLIDLGNR